MRLLRCKGFRLQFESSKSFKRLSEPALTTTLIVLAHPDPRSFNGAWANATEAACEALGDTVLRSDLVALGFDPVEAAKPQV